MSVIGIGVDVIECSRIQHSIERFGDRFLHRVFTDGEIEYSMSMKFPERHLAARFAGRRQWQKRSAPGSAKRWDGATLISAKKRAANLFWFFQGRRKLLPQNGASLRLSSLSATRKITLSRALFLKVQRLSRNNPAIQIGRLRSGASANCSQTRSTSRARPNRAQIIPNGSWA